MRTRIEQIKEEIELTMELLRLRRELDEFGYARSAKEVKPAVDEGLTQIKFNFPPIINNYGGGIVPSNVVGSFFCGGPINSASTAKVEPVKWDDSETMWKGVEKPNYFEGRGPCECEY